ncbi:hypothetical protein [Beduini massiliensis]|uniref:hypothetical protein n=1 Tax=Beduini massiliensis TaxID=1585974 RepID=UPI00059AAC05|nr:hypothetical protein [Beduini massiliensis]
MKRLNTLIKQYSKLIYFIIMIIGVIAASGFFLRKQDLVNCDAQIIVNRMYKESDFKNALNYVNGSVVDLHLNPPKTLEQHYYPLSYTTFRYLDQQYGRIEVYKNKEAAQLRIKYLESLQTYGAEVFTAAAYGDYVANDRYYKYHYNTTQIKNVVLITSINDPYSQQQSITTKAFEKAMNGLRFTQQNKISASEYEVLLSTLDKEAETFISSHESKIRNEYITFVNNEFKILENEPTQRNYSMTKSFVDKMNAPQYSNEYENWCKRLEELEPQVEEYEVYQNNLMKSRYGKGVYKVGTDIPEGEYIAFYDRGSFYVRSGAEDYSSALNKETLYTNKTLVISVKKGEYIHYTGSNYFYSIDANPSVNLSEGGIFKVGLHLPAGEYRIIPENSDNYSNQVNIYKDSYYRDNPIIKVYGQQLNDPIFLEEGQYVQIKNCQLKRIDN